ncbi:KpsF/GutQ family sugar-phosphate isomerase [Magnetovibrio sp. PR-2]|uniref:KpsF/GutQ family sugar-phosphate isomerase n=1 Tax=Magnetovibrio sp. PR-2 TaxID=3120356 RepID=UPI002FCDFCFE
MAQTNTKTQAPNDLQAARDVLKTEAVALEALADSLDGPFIAALDLIDQATGRVVVTGMGKSGHVGNKIAATMASTGQPAFFVHPGEASHGDLGMIQTDDVVIALSNSGETSELSDIIAFTRRHRIGLIGMTRGAGSTLAEASDVALVPPNSPEACSIGLAPTTSTTQMLALGDALAVCLLDRKGFTAQDFQKYHPGGKLGQRLLKVADLMHAGDQVPLIDMATPMSDALIVMTQKSFGVVGVKNADGGLAGIITDGDLRRHMSSDLINQTAQDVMTEGCVTVQPSQIASEALAIMNERKITALFCVEDGKPAGILHIHDCLRAGVA